MNIGDDRLILEGETEWKINKTEHKCESMLTMCSLLYLLVYCSFARERERI